MWDELIARAQKEKAFWRTIEESGQRYDGAESEFKDLRLSNTRHLSDILKTEIWPKISEYGEEVNGAAFSIARASVQSPSEMKYFAEKISESVSNGESKPIHLAAIQDCISYYEDKPQTYGMFLEWKVDGELYANVTNIDEANIKRKALQLPPLQEAIKAHREELASNPGSQPNDIAVHNKMHRSWAKSVGW